MWQETQCSSRVGTGISGNFWSFVKHFENPFEFQGKLGLSLETLQCKRASSSVQARISSFACSCGGKLRVPLELPVDLGDRLCFLREFRSALALQGPPRDSSSITSGMNRASSQDEAGTSAFLSSGDGYLWKLLEFCKVCQEPFRVPRETWAFFGNTAG